jgi:HEPN domain-containing protein
MASEQDLAEQLLRRADEDAAGAKGMLSIDEVADVLVCFHAQQAVEKALKAVLAAHGVEFAHRHDLRVLIGQCEDAGLQLPEELVEVDLLSPYAAELHYDDDTVHAVERETASRWATAAVQWARGLVEEAGVDRSPQLSPKSSMGAERR